MIGGLKPTDAAKGITQAVNIQQSISSVVTLTNIGNLGMQLGLDSAFTNIIGLSLSAIQGIQIQNPTTTLQQAFSQVKSKIANSLAQYGIEKVGKSIGFSPLVSSLAALPIASAVGESVKLGAVTGKTIIESVQQGLLGSAIGYGTEYAIGQLPIPQLAMDFLTNVVSRSLLNLTDSTLPRSDLTTLVLESVTQAGKNLFLPPNLPKLVEAIASEGWVKGLEKYATSVFQRDTVETILASSENLAQYINDRLSQAKPVTFNDQQAKLLDLSKDGNFLQVLYVETADGIRVLGYFEKGSLHSWSDSSQRTGSVRTYLDNGSSITRYFKDGVTEKIEIADKNQNVIARIYPGKNGALGMIENLAAGASITFMDQNHVELKISNEAGNLTQQDMINLTSLSQDKRDEMTALILGFGNGFSNDSAEGNLPQFMTGFIDDLKRDGILGGNVVYGAALYEQTSLVDNMIDWLKGAFLGSDVLSREVEDDFDEFWNSLTPSQKQERIVYFTHSGHFKPLTQALEHRQDIPIHTIFNYEGSYVGDDIIDNPNLKRLINVNGTAPPIPGKKSFLTVSAGQILVDYKDVETGLVVQQKDVDTGDPFVAFVGKRSFQGIENYNFEILGARHSDFSYDPSNYPVDATGRVADVKEINRRTNIIIRQMYRASLNESRWRDFIARTDVVLTKREGTAYSYTINPMDFDLEESNND